MFPIKSIIKLLVKPENHIKSFTGEISRVHTGRSVSFNRPSRDSSGEYSRNHYIYITQSGSNCQNYTGIIIDNGSRKLVTSSGYFNTLENGKVLGVNCPLTTKQHSILGYYRKNHNVKIKISIKNTAF